ncbi:uncharacterized protein FN964_015283 isoform 1-T1 [Alca torda]
MAGAGATILCGVLVAAAGGPHLCCGAGVLTGLKGHSLSFPALHSDSGDIARVTWRSRGTHMAEAKPRERPFAVGYLPSLGGRPLLQPTNLRPEISPLKPGESGRHEGLVGAFSDPTNLKTFSYFLLVRGGSAGAGDSGGGSGSTAGRDGARCWRRHAAGRRWGAAPGRRRGDGDCMVKGCLVATVFGPLLMLVATVHIVPRDKATEPGGMLGVSPVGCEPPGIAAPQGPSPWRSPDLGGVEPVPQFPQLGRAQAAPIKPLEAAKRKTPFPHLLHKRLPQNAATPPLPPRGHRSTMMGGPGTPLPPPPAPQRTPAPSVPRHRLPAHPRPGTPPIAGHRGFPIYGPERRARE